MGVNCVQFRVYFRKLLVAFLLGATSLVLAGSSSVPKDQGIGGTGYIGTIIDFGSIIINGREIDLDVQTRVRIDGATGDISDLKKGHVIAARSDDVDGIEKAVTIDVIKIAIGRLDHFDPSTGLGVILGQVIDFNSRLDSETLTRGNWYAVSGLRAENDVVIASLIEASPQGVFLVRGTAAQIQNALTDLKVKNRQIPNGDTLVLSGLIRSDKAQIRRLQPYSLLSTLKQPSVIWIESYVGRSTSRDGVVTLSQTGTPFVLSKTMRNAMAGAQERIVLKAQKSARRFIVNDVATAPFVDRASERSMSLSKTAIDDVSDALSDRDDTTERESDDQSDDQNEDQSGGKESKESEGPEGSEGSQNGDSSGESDGGSDSDASDSNEGSSDDGQKDDGPDAGHDDSKSQKDDGRQE